MSARLALVVRLDPARFEPPAKDAFSIRYLPRSRKWRGEMIGGALLPVKSIASDEFYVQSSDHTRIAFTRDAVGKVDGAVLNPGPWQQRGAIVL